MRLPALCAQKLEGVSEVSGLVKGVAAQVAELLAEARDPDKLSRMYVGWMPFA